MCFVGSRESRILPFEYVTRSAEETGIMIDPNYKPREADSANFMSYKVEAIFRDVPIRYNTDDEPELMRVTIENYKYDVSVKFKNSSSGLFAKSIQKSIQKSMDDKKISGAPDWMVNARLEYIDTLKLDIYRSQYYEAGVLQLPKNGEEIPFKEEPIIWDNSKANSIIFGSKPLCMIELKFSNNQGIALDLDNMPDPSDIKVNKDNSTRRFLNHTDMGHIDFERTRDKKLLEDESQEIIYRHVPVFTNIVNKSILTLYMNGYYKEYSMQFREHGREYTSGINNFYALRSI